MSEKLTLNLAEVRDLALFCGFHVDGNGAETRNEEELETQVSIEHIPAGLQDDDGTVRHYAHQVWFEEYPEEGAMGLGPELKIGWEGMKQKEETNYRHIIALNKYCQAVTKELRDADTKKKDRKGWKRKG